MNQDLILDSKNVFRPELNQLFLDSRRNKETRKENETFFNNSLQLEVRYNKNLFAFDFDQLQAFLKKVNTKTYGSFMKNFSILNNYLKWAKKNNFIQIMPDMKALKESENYVNINLELDYIKDREELYSIAEDKRINRQDAVLLILAFEGVEGEKWQEIFNLKVSNCKFENNLLILHTKRQIIIPQRSMNIIRQAIEEKKYRTNKKVISMPESEYVIKPIIKRDYSTDEAIRPVSNLRINNIKECIGEITGKTGLNGTTVAISGMIDYIKHLNILKEKLLIEDFKKIRIRFGKNLSTSAYTNLKMLYNEYKKVCGNNWFSFSNYITKENLAFFDEKLPEAEKDDTDEREFQFDLSTDDDTKLIIDFEQTSWANEPDLWDGNEEVKKKLITHFVLERNNKLISSAKKLFKYKHNGELYCEICKFNFKNIYGDIGEGFIEGHHIVPLSVIINDPTPYKSDIKNIIIVCSNCHRMLHRKKHWEDETQLSVFEGRENKRLSINSVFNNGNV